MGIRRDVKVARGDLRVRQQPRWGLDHKLRGAMKKARRSLRRRVKRALAGGGDLDPLYSVPWID